MRKRRGESSVAMRLRKPNMLAGSANFFIYFIFLYFFFCGKAVRHMSSSYCKYARLAVCVCMQVRAYALLRMCACAFISAFLCRRRRFFTQLAGNACAGALIYQQGAAFMQFVWKSAPRIVINFPLVLMLVALALAAAWVGLGTAASPKCKH